MMAVDNFSAEYITAKALATRQTPEEVIHALVSNDTAASPSHENMAAEA